MNKMIGFWVVVIIIVSLVLGIALKKDFLISYNDIIYINLYMYTYDIDTYNPDKVVKVSEENKITEIIKIVNSEKAYRKSFNAHGMQNSVSGYIEIIYNNHLSEKLYFSENKKIIFKVRNGFIRDYYIYRNNEEIYNRIVNIAR